MHLLITGGAGFIGTHFVEMVVRQPEVKQVIVFDAFGYASHPMKSHDNVVVEQGNLRDANKTNSILRKYPIDWVVHMAAETHVDRSIIDPERFVRTNVLGTANLLTAVRQCGRAIKQFVYVSTDEVYGTVMIGRSREEDAMNPSSPYAASKAAAEMLCIAEHVTHGLSIIVTRGTNTYGPGQNREKLIPMTVSRVMKREPIPIYGDGQQVRDWMHVLDHCSGIWAAMKYGIAGYTFNLGTRNCVSNLVLVQRICQIIEEEGGPKTARLQHVTDRKGHDRRYAVDPSKAEQLLEWKPGQPFDLRQTVKSYMSEIL